MKEDIIIINAADEEFDSQRKAMEERREVVRLAKVTYTYMYDSHMCM